MSVIGQEPRERINQLFERHVNSGKVEFFRNAGIDFIFGRREGVYVYDIDGKRRLINCNSNGGVFNLGHHNPRSSRPWWRRSRNWTSAPTTP